MTQSAGLHEPADTLSDESIDRHRAIVSIQEELEAIDWYDQRVQATTDAELADDPRPQPRRGEGARVDDPRVAAPPRPRRSTRTCAPTCSAPVR